MRATTPSKLLTVAWTLSLGLLAFGAGGATASQATPVVRTPVAVYRLHAVLRAVGTATGSGRFDALLVRSGPGPAPRTTAPRVPPVPVTCPPNPRMGMPCRIGPGGQFPPFPTQPAGVHWMLLWRLSLTGVIAPATAELRLAAQGPSGTLLTKLCTDCGPVTDGRITLTANQAVALIRGHSSAQVRASSGQLSGRIITLNHFITTAA